MSTTLAMSVILLLALAALACAQRLLVNLRRADRALEHLLGLAIKRAMDEAESELTRAGGTPDGPPWPTERTDP